ncbi:HNH endonuclease [Pseudomonas sp. MMS21-TM103]|uniref:HNH endonuclease n=1 Tax=Pseudomonas sp. MMS21 TM103 TaxID=2886506 RepID=UPI001EE0EDD7|nr:HNH endonuclease [Pseudomonas sp. MMS21 TM103]MCG4453335.1 HNH endonuclease [Pseudomonas sp. MMS21 TM103]
MIAGKKDLILRELEDGTGAAIAVAVDRSGLRSGLRIWFGDLDEKHGPVSELRPHGLKGHRVTLIFGNFSGAVIGQIRKASPEDVQLARALVASIRQDIEIEIPGESLSQWSVTTGAFQMRATIRELAQPLEDAEIIGTCRDVIVPMMAAMAELIGYDVIEEAVDDESPAFEGATLKSVVQRRERNPRNRLLCIRIHGEKCVVCGLEPRFEYGEAGSIIEVHHLEPLSLLIEPRPYDPRTDLVPLCPNCHRAAHTRHPIPFSIEELKDLRGSCRD